MYLDWPSLLVFRNGPVRSFGIFYATFEKQNGDFFIPSVKKVDLKNRKNEKMAQNGQFWAYFGVFEWLNLFRPNFAPAVKLYFLSFLRIMMGGNLKSPAITRNKIFCVKNVAFLPNHKVFWVKMYLKSGVSGKGFLAPGNGKGNWKSHSRFTGRERELANCYGKGREGKFEACNPGKSRESYKKQD